MSPTRLRRRRGIGAIRLIKAIQRSNRGAARRLLATAPDAARPGGPAGSTALMFAALYGDAQVARDLLEDRGRSERGESCRRHRAHLGRRKQ